MAQAHCSPKRLWKDLSGNIISSCKSHGLYTCNVSPEDLNFDPHITFCLKFCFLGQITAKQNLGKSETHGFTADFFSNIMSNNPSMTDKLAALC